jgi:acyl-CoA synthetase (NDP forming)/RimJ/RimL family protein N-acetyltransferase
MEQDEKRLDHPEYPSSWAADVALRDGHTVRVRPIAPEDAVELGRFHDRQSPESVYFRFMSPRPQLSEKELRYFTEIDYRDRMAFVAVLGDEIVAVARYERYKGTDTAEVAFFVDDRHNGRGLATVMLEYLAAAARHRGIRRFTASTLPNNRKMLSVFARAGFDVSSRLEDGVVALSFGIDPTDESTAAVDSRERQAEAATVEQLLAPRSVAVIGSPAPGAMGRALAEAISAGGYTGEVTVVSGRPGGTADSRAGTPGDDFAVLREVPEGVDLALVAVPARDVQGVVELCAAAGVGAIIVHSAGFSEAGGEGAERERELLEVARRHGLRLLGPASLGLVNNDPEVRLHATVAQGRPPQGRVAMLAGSGTLAAALLEEAERRQLGLSTFVEGGNEADVGPADMLSFWADDPGSDAVLLYMRSSGIPTRLVRAAHAASLRKPVALLGRVFLNAADAAETQRRVEALTRQTGVISVGTLEQLFDIGRLCADQPVPRGRGVAVIGNSEGAVGMAADACRGAGLEVVALGGSATGWEGLSNPVNLTYRAEPEDFRRALDAVAADEAVHSVLLVYTPPRMVGSIEVAEAVVEASRAHPDVTFAATMLGSADAPRIGDNSHRVPVFAFPEHAALAMGRLAEYRAWTESPRDNPTGPPLGCDLEAANEVVSAALGRRGPAEPVFLDLEEQTRLLDAYAVPVAEREVVEGREDAPRAAERLGWPVAIKAARRDRRNRSAAGGVAVDLNDENDLLATWDRMAGMLGDDMHPAAIQRYIERGIDAAVRLTRTSGGAVIEVGLGGPAAHLDEPQLGILPLTLEDAQALVTSSALGRALPDPLDRVALVGVVQRLAELAEQIEEVRLIDADPIVASVEGAWVADVRIEVAPADDTLTVRKLD